MTDNNDQINKNFNDYLSDLHSSSSSWYNTDLQYRNNINITTASSAVPSGYTVSLIFNHALLVNKGKSRADGNDVRVVYRYGSDWEELDRILDTASSWNSNSTKIWFKLQMAISANSFDNNYFLYYGNLVSDLPPTNSSNVFLFYDNFESGDLNAWDGFSEGSGDEVEITDYITHTGNYAVRCYIDNGGGACLYNDFPALEAIHTSTWFFLPNNYSDAHYTSLIMYYSEYSNQLAAVNIYEPPDAMTPYLANLMGSGFYFSDENLSLNEWHRLEIKIIVSDTSGRAELWVDGINKVNKTNINTGTEAIVNSNVGIFYRTADATTIFFDDSFDRLWIDPEPITSLGTEEMLRPLITDFKYYKEITIDHTKVSGINDLINFPVLISLFDSDLQLQAQPDGDDITFYNGSEWLDHEIELFNQDFNSTHAQLIAWVRIPSLSTSIDTKIYMYYGNSSIKSQQNPSGVWDDDYCFVLHMNQDPTSSDIIDSTGNGFNFKVADSMTSDDLIDGQTGKAISFDGVNDFIYLPFSEGFNGPTNAMTFEFWLMFPNGWHGGYRDCVATPATTALDPYLSFYSDVFEFHVETSSGAERLNSNANVSEFILSAWYHIVAVWEGSGSGLHRIYINGSFDNEDSSPRTGTHVSWNTLSIGAEDVDPPGVSQDDDRYINAAFSEFRVSKITRSADWIATEYNNQYNYRSFYDISKAIRINALAINYFNYYKEIIIDHTKVSGINELINFPVLISLFDSDLRIQTQADGEDIVFYSGSEWLDHEIELFDQDFNSTHAQLVAWVRIPSLSTSIDTKIYMYYGNSTIRSQENPTGVWDSNYGAIWHLNEKPNDGTIGGHKDSTANSNDGTPQNFQDSGGGSTVAIGNIDGAVNCSGDDDYITISNPINIDPVDELTISAWIKVNDSISHHGEIISRGDSYAIRVWTDGRILFYKYDGNSWINMAPTGVDVIDNKFHYIVAGQNTSGMFLFIDGVQKEINTNTNAINYTLGNTLEIGRHANGDGGYNFSGIIDESRISKVGHSADWIATEYNNQDDPNTFCSIGEEFSQRSLNSDYFAYFKEITIDHTKVSGSESLVNFPILISILDSDLHNKVQPDGDDIAFFSESKWLDHEIEIFNQFYNDTHAQLVVWVRIPFLSPSIDTNITMYYGNSTMQSQESPFGVWDPNFVGVWHLNESGTGVVNEYLDSGHYGNHGQGGLGTVNYVPNQTSGPIGFGQNFTDHFIDCGNDTSLDITTNQITLELWIKYPTTHNWMGPINHKGYNYGYRLVMDINSPYLKFQLPGAEDELESSQSISSDVWHHVVATYDAAFMKIYIDGVEDPLNLSKSNDVSSALPYPFRIGQGDHPEGQAWSYPWVGQIDEVRISNIGRSADWIATEYNNQYDPNNFYSIGPENQIEDIYPPEITINSPYSNELFEWSVPNYDLTVTDANLDSIWYSLDGGTTNSTPVSASGTIDQSMWSALDNGTVTIRFYANDTLGYLNYEEVVIRKDVIEPSIIINSPISNELFGWSASDYDLAIKEANLDSIWYSFNGGITNSTPVSASGTIDQAMWSTLGNGTITIRFYANDTLGNTNYEEVIVRKDVIEPSITINFPISNELFGWSAPDYDLAITEANLDSIWYSFNGGITNSTPVSASGTIDQAIWSALGNGTVTIRFYANDTLGNTDYEEVIVRKDIIEPSITINSPNDNDLFGLNAPDYDLTITEVNLDSIWYSFNGGITNSTPVSASETIDQAMWSTLGNGTVTIRFYANDTLGNTNYEEVIVRKDVIEPSITINSPISNELFGWSAPDYDLAITEANLDSIWYSLDGGTTNSTSVSASGTIDQVMWSALGNGTITIRFYANDTLSNSDYEEVIVRKDIIEPLITISSPDSNELFGWSASDYDLTITEANLDSIWYSFNAGITNSTPVSASGTIDQAMWSALGNGTVTIRFYANDTLGNTNYEEVIVRKDIIEPSITVNSPNENDLFGLNAPDYDLTVTDTNLDSIWYSFNAGITNSTPVSASGTIDQAMWSALGNGTVTIRFYANDTLGNINYEEVIVRKDIILPFVDITTPSYDGAQIGGPIISIGGLGYGTGSNIVSMYINDTRWGDGSQKPQLDPSGSQSGLFMFSNNTYIVPGFYWIEINITDTAGNFNTSVRYFEVIIEDLTAPILVISSISPDPTKGFTEIIVSSNENLKFSPLLNITLPNSSVVYRPMILIAALTWCANYSVDADGIYTVRVNGTDDADNVGYAMDSFIGDITPPSITINNPILNDLFGSNIPAFDVTISDSSGINTQWYTIDAGNTNYTFIGSTGTINQTAWSGQGNGTVIIRFYANDTAGNFWWEEVSVRKDINPPSITINNPNLNDLFGSNTPAFDVTISDSSGINTQWYTIDAGNTNYTFIGSTGTINQLAWSGEGNGTVMIRFYANDTAGNIWWEEVSVRKDINPPFITINNPNLDELFGTIAPTFDVSISDSSGINTQWYTIDDGNNNYTFIGSTGIIDQFAWSGQGNGTVIIRFYANDTAGNIWWEEVSVRKDSLNPTINIIEPSDYDLFGNLPPNVVINVIDPNLDEVWYQLDNGTIITSNTTWTGVISQSVWDQVGNGTVIIRFYANDTLGNLGTAEVIVYKDILLPIININTPGSDELYSNIAPNFTISISGSNLNTTWYTLNDGLVNYTFTGLTGVIDQAAWDAQVDGNVTIKFYINNTLGFLGFDEVSVRKDTLAPQITINLPSNNTYYGVMPIISVLATDANLDAMWYEVNTIKISLGNNVNQQLDVSIWNSLPDGEFYIYIYANDSIGHLNDLFILTLNKDTTAPSAPLLINIPQGEVSGPLIFEWQAGSDPSGISKYRLIIDTEANPFATPGFVFEINITTNYYEYTGSLQPGTYYFCLYQIDGTGHQSPASTGNFIIKSTIQPSQPPEFPLWILLVIVGAVIGGIVGAVVLKKSKSKKIKPIDVSQKKSVSIQTVEAVEKVTMLDYETLKSKNQEELTTREKILLDNIKTLEENQSFTKAAELLGEIIIIEEFLGNTLKSKSYRQKQIDIALKGLDYLKNEYEKESKKAALSGDYSKSLELYKESQVISQNLKNYVESQEFFEPEEDIPIAREEIIELLEEVTIVYSCINDLLTKYFDEIGIKYYSNPRIYEDPKRIVHGLILNTDKSLIENLDPKLIKKIKAIQIIYVDDISKDNLKNLCLNFQNSSLMLIIVSVAWKGSISTQTIELPEDRRIKYPENIKIMHYDLFAKLIGLQQNYEIAFNEIIDLYSNSEIDILEQSHISSQVKLHDSEELLEDLKQKGLVRKNIREYFKL